MNPSIERYKGEHYLDNNPTWHIEDAPWKARNISDILNRNNIAPESIVEIGCGAGQILNLLAAKFPDCNEFDGYDVSPHALDLASQTFPTSNKVKLHLGDVHSIPKKYDVGLAIDVIEHIEDCFLFLRTFKSVCRIKIYHIPLDIFVLGVARSHAMLNIRRTIGHIHSFTLETALELLAETGHVVHDFRITNGAVDLDTKSIKRRLAKIPRSILNSISPYLCARWLGGASILVLAE